MDLSAPENCAWAIGGPLVWQMATEEWLIVTALDRWSRGQVPAVHQRRQSTRPEAFMDGVI